MTPEEEKAADERISKVSDERKLSYVGAMGSHGNDLLLLDGIFTADDLRALADAMDGRQAIREAEATMKERCAETARFMGSPDYTRERDGGHGKPADGAEIAAAILALE